MSQFILFHGELTNIRKVNKVLIIKNNQINDYIVEKYLDYFIRKYNLNKKLLWLIIKPNFTSDELFTDTKEYIHTGKKLDSPLIKFININHYKIFDIIMWYSDYYEDLEEVKDYNELIKEIIHGISSDMCEVFLHYKRRIKN